MVCGSKREKKEVLDICLVQHGSYECRSKEKINYLGHRFDTYRTSVIEVSDTDACRTPRHA